MELKKRILIIFLTTAFIFGTLFSILYITIESHHDCIGEDCPICQCIIVCENILKKLSTAFGIVSIYIAFKFASKISIINYFKLVPIQTLVSLKVKLSN
ncbi:hypothetical protein [Brachyspira catarrhinii]|uniref:AraC family transcriptional regulator n=1 Tax=Brachyspira catarrhinii TaxID=2528966 RepID=A0ABY2TTR8_9SPIR|nr:hypothetical protein [Brachyspira catarrhinii]TKZ35858.1 hypothetical protein EZH24_03060 [Brachyspira catarrhinii]